MVVGNSPSLPAARTGLLEVPVQALFGGGERRLPAQRRRPPWLAIEHSGDRFALESGLPTKELRLPAR